MFDSYGIPVPVINLTSSQAQSILDMSYPVQCLRCFEIHDASKVTNVRRYADCDMWKCPKCKGEIDTRAGIGSSRPVSAEMIDVVKMLTGADA